MKHEKRKNSVWSPNWTLPTASTRKKTGEQRTRCAEDLVRALSVRSTFSATAWLYGGDSSNSLASTSLTSPIKLKKKIRKENN